MSAATGGPAPASTGRTGDSLGARPAIVAAGGHAQARALAVDADARAATQPRQPASEPAAPSPTEEVIATAAPGTERAISPLMWMTGAACAAALALWIGLRWMAPSPSEPLAAPSSAQTQNATALSDAGAVAAGQTSSSTTAVPGAPQTDGAAPVTAPTSSVTTAPAADLSRSERASRDVAGASPAGTVAPRRADAPVPSRTAIAPPANRIDSVDAGRRPAAPDAAAPRAVEPVSAQGAADAAASSGVAPTQPASPPAATSPEPSATPPAPVVAPSVASPQIVPPATTAGSAASNAPVAPAAAGGGGSALVTRPARVRVQAQPVLRGDALGSMTTGAVTVAVSIDATGRATSVRSTSGPMLLRDAAEDAARRSRFEPSLQNGVPVAGTVALTFVFTRPATDVRSRSLR